MKATCFVFILVFYVFLGSEAQLTPPRCPSVDGYSYIPHPYPCYFYACYGGKLVSAKAFECPDDPDYYKRLLASGVTNVCSRCASVYLKSSSPATDTTTSPSTTRPTSTISTMTSVTSAPTTMTTSGTTSLMGTMKEIYYVQTSAHLFNGQYAGGVTTLRQCLYRCEETTTCVGFDFNRNDNTCWLHNVTTICTAAEEKTGCIHFRLYNNCPGTTTPTSSMMPGFSSSTMNPGQTTTSGYTMSYRGYHLANGTMIPLAAEMATPEACVAICRMDNDCAGVDFDTSTKTCWMHSELTECTKLIPKPYCTHYRLKEGVCAPPTTTFTQTGTTTTTTTTPSNLVGGSTPEGVNNGFVESVNNFHVPGGYKMFTDVTLRQCMDSCLVTPYCLALDYDELERTCYFHFRDTYCNLPEELYGVKHYKRVSCVRDVENDVAATWYHFHVDGGQLLCSGCTLTSCLEACFSDMECAGLDFDMRDLGCYLFKPDTVCGPLIPLDYTIHVSRDLCVPAQLVGVPPQNLVTMTYPTASGLPSRWQAFPGVRVRNGIQTGGRFLGPDQCVSSCENDMRCLSGDYDTADGTCWLHISPETECSQPESSDTVFHFKKQSCEYVYGSMEPYISPVWTAL